MDRIDEIIDKATRYTEEILKRAPHLYSAAREGLEIMRGNLEIGAEDHPALRKLDGYLGQLGRRYSN